MPEYLESAPKSWKCRLVLAAVPRDGAPYEDEFTLPFDRAVSYWDQIYQPLSDLNVRVTAFRSEGRVVAEVYKDVMLGSVPDKILTRFSPPEHFAKASAASLIDASA